jgi:hypothetical protein
MSDEFIARYVVRNFRGDIALHPFKINACDIPGNMDDSDLKDLYEELIYEDYRLSVYPEAEKVDEFVAWAKDAINNKGED